MEWPYSEELALLWRSDLLHLAATKVRRSMKDGEDLDGLEPLEQRRRCVDEGEDTGVLPRGAGGGRSAKEHCAADSAEEHGFLEADHRSTGRAGKGHTVVRVSSLPSFPN